MDEILRILRPGAPFAFTVKRSEWDSLGFGAKIAALADSGALRVGSIAPDRLYANSPEPDGMMCVVWRVKLVAPLSRVRRVTLFGGLARGSF